MVATQRVTGPMILAVGFALTTAITPAALVLGGTGPPGKYVVTADPTQPCTVFHSNGSDALVCRPNSFTPDNFLPSEQGLTLQNEIRH